MEEVSNTKEGATVEPLTESGGSAEVRDGCSSARSSESSVNSPPRAEVNSASASFGWPIRLGGTPASRKSMELVGKVDGGEIGGEFAKMSSKISEMDMMKERFSKLLLGEDMSGSGKGVCAALAISNAITNLCATVFGQLWRLEPLPSEKQAMWKREMEWLLCVGDHIVELIPSWQTLPDGSKLEVMTCRPRSDIFINIPALKKLDNMLIEILDGFKGTEFWYVDQGIINPEINGSTSFRKSVQRQEEKWWLPVPRVPPLGLSDSSRKQLSHTRECASQILKAAMAINSNTLEEMDVPESYLEALPKNGRACLGDLIYRYLTSDQFSVDCLLDCLDLSSEHVALEIANKIESSIYVWRRRAHCKPAAKSSWEMVKDLVADGDKRELFAGRAEALLITLKQRFPNMTQTALDTSKIQFNEDVGKALLESYSRVLESLASNIVARIDDLLYVDDLTKRCDTKVAPASSVSVITTKNIPIQYSVPVTVGTPCKTVMNDSPCKVKSPTRTPFLNKTNIVMENNSNKSQHHRLGHGVRKALSSYLAGTAPDSKSKIGDSSDKLCINPNCNTTWD